ncbi:MAG: 3-oxoacyl-[acyl-carrier-protein] synthase III C-terminal domain-containing protein [Spirochaetota bacterium]|nr:3-oxoacyl-[acyl-carrier-protein] synthase III C-terminal domain-containing protein [Spirochaetota bacterium]
MIGIMSYGAYIPILRLERDLIAKSWGRASLRGERSVANNDEDTLTMSVEAVSDCLSNFERKDIGGVYYASTSAPYKEKQISTLLAKVLDLNEEITSGDFANSLRAATSALKACIDTVKSGSANNMIVAASDSRIGYPRSDEEQLFGDGAAALLLGSTNVIANIVDHVSFSNEIVDVWRNPEDTYVRSWEKRWVLSEGYQKIMKKAVSALMKKCELEPGNISKLVLSAPDLRSGKSLCKSLGFDSEKQMTDPLLSTVGNCGTAHPLMILVSALEDAKPGDKIILASHGNGADAFFIEVTERISDFTERRGIKKNLESKLTLSSYERFLSYRGLLEAVPGEPFRLLPSATAYWRDMDSILSCLGSKCRKCGTASYPKQRVCYNCRSKDDYDIIHISDRKGKVFDFTLDNLAGRSDDPVVIQTIIETDEDQCRVYALMTDCDPSKVYLGMPVEMTFRRFYEGADFHNYYWKCRPVRDGGR